jgi:hypothetical protein
MAIGLEPQHGSLSGSSVRFCLARTDFKSRGTKKDLTATPKPNFQPFSAQERLRNRLVFGTAEVSFVTAEVSFGTAEVSFVTAEAIFVTAEVSFGTAEVSFGMVESSFWHGGG